MSKRLNGIPNALARDAATVFGTVFAAIFISNCAIAEPVVEATTTVETASQTSQPASDGTLVSTVNAALESAASQLAGVISPNPRPVASSERDREVRCLAEAIYFEARGEPERGQLAVAEVVANRVASRAYPNTYCGVVRQRSRSVCQFSWACDSGRGAPRGVQWERANTIAERVVDGWKPNVVGNATHFHATFVSPSWSRSLPRVARIGTHVFYRSR
jgi:spore germination cell wall hydrolase CwlJ-like protein